MAKRLNKVAKEFNISISTIVDFLGTKGIEIDSKPNTKIEADILSVLDGEFADDKVAKLNSETVDIGREKRESISLKDVKKETAPVDEEDDEDDEVEDVRSATFNQPKKVEPPVVVKEVVAEIVEKVEEKGVEKPVEVEVKEEIKPEVAAKTEELKPTESTDDTVKKVAVIGKIDIDAINQRTRPVKKKN